LSLDNDVVTVDVKDDINDDDDDDDTEGDDDNDEFVDEIDTIPTTMTLLTTTWLHNVS